MPSSASIHLVAAETPSVVHDLPTRELSWNAAIF
jgi:hypothetical protein